jgi:hypothetical protein
MTTIVYRDGIIAADSLVVSGGTKLPGKVDKVFDLGDGYYTFCGDTARGHLVLASLLEDEDLPTWNEDDTTCIRIDDDGACWIYEGMGPWQKEGGPYHAWGSGRDLAFGALYWGHNAVEAVEVAMAHDTLTEAPIQVIHVGVRE